MIHACGLSRPLLGAVLLASLPALAHAQAAVSPHPHILSVSGEGEVRAAPDQAQLSAGVVTQAKTAAQALAENSQAMTEVFAALKKRGIPEKSIATSNFSIAPQYPPFNANLPEEDRRKIIGYQVSNEVSVTLDDTAKVGATLDALVAAGANQTNGVRFSIRDPKPLLAAAREKAVADAVAKAQTLAKAAGVTLGPILSIQEGAAPRPMPMYARAMVETVTVTSAKAPPMAAGEQTVSADVSITWEIQE